MPFTVQDFHDLVRLLEEHPEWQAELRRLLLSRELLEMPARIQELLQAHRAAEERLRRIETAVAQLVESRQETERRLQRLEATVAQLAKGQEELRATVAQLIESQQETERRLQRLEATVAQLAKGQEELRATVAQLAKGQEELRATVAQLIESQQETEQRLQRLEATVAQLAKGQEELRATVAQLIESQQETERRLQRLEATVAQLAKGQEELRATVAQLAKGQEELRATVAQLIESQQETERRLQRLEATVAQLGDQMKTLNKIMTDFMSTDLERQYRENAPAYFGRLLRRIRVLSSQHLADLLEDALDQGEITWRERDDVLEADVVLRGRSREDGTERYLVAEVSWGVGSHDVERASRRARILERVLGQPVLAAVAGKRIDPAVEQYAREMGVWQVVDGYIRPPDQGAPKE